MPRPKPATTLAATAQCPSRAAHEVALVARRAAVLSSRLDAFAERVLQDA